MVQGDVSVLFYVALLGLFAGVVLVSEIIGDLVVGGGFTPTPEGVSVMYLYPARCIDCEKRIPPTCDSCVTYYSDPVVLDAVAGDVGVPLNLYVSDSVSEPTLLVARGTTMSLGDARTKLSIAGVLCSTLGVEQSCKVFNDRLFAVKKCFEGYNITSDTIVYQYADDCGHCEPVAAALNELLTLEYLGRPYTAVSIDSGNEAEVKVLRECAGGIVNTRYVPNVFCPANGRVRTGEMGLAGLRDFADDCMDAAV